MRSSLPTHSRVRSRPNQAVDASVAGTAHILLAFVALVFFGLGGMYIFAVNERAVYGYDMRTLEQELTTLKKDNARLRLDEARGKSLTTVESGSANLRMERADPGLELMIERPGSVAYR